MRPKTPQAGDGVPRAGGLSKHLRLVAPVYQPDVAAKGILWAPDHPRRELWVGVPTYYTIVGNWFAPGVQDRFLAKKNYAGQQSDRPLAPNRQDYLFAALDEEEDRGVHGIFGDEAQDHSVALAATHAPRSMAAAGAALAIAGGVLRRVRS